MGNFVPDLLDGESCERIVNDYLSSQGLIAHGARQSHGYEPAYDFVLVTGEKHEYKFDILATITGNLAIEFGRRKKNKDNGEYYTEDSGISVSQADKWVIFYCEDTGEFLKNWDLNYLWPQIFIIDKTELFNFARTKPYVKMGDNLLTLGYVLPIQQLIAQPWCETIDMPLDAPGMNDLLFILINKLKTSSEKLRRKFGKYYE